ncbi:hypothetical protein SAMN05660236_1851 [Ohtaekwangia koreensis]|uniref:Uncharacterized protein n=1 Tax=Ohtaekwangia koreensis TaxID=688867 RepID=A0A1T5K6F2_9BACT|nr:hypothetical protein SAMN05660236_1851 [Ohtaekwangia koreensis]
MYHLSRNIISLFYLKDEILIQKEITNFPNTHISFPNDQDYFPKHLKCLN